VGTSSVNFSESLIESLNTTNFALQTSNEATNSTELNSSTVQPKETTNNQISLISTQTDSYTKSNNNEETSSNPLSSLITKTSIITKILTSSIEISTEKTDIIESSDTTTTIATTATIKTSNNEDTQTTKENSKTSTQETTKLFLSTVISPNTSKPIEIPAIVSVNTTTIAMQPETTKYIEIKTTSSSSSPVSTTTIQESTISLTNIILALKSSTITDIMDNVSSNQNISELNIVATKSTKPTVSTTINLSIESETVWGLFKCKKLNSNECKYIEIILIIVISCSITFIVNFNCIRIFFFKS
jgi:hypothetical protein